MCTAPSQYHIHKVDRDGSLITSTPSHFLSKSLALAFSIIINRPDPIAFLPLAVDTSGRLYDDFIRLLFLDAHRQTSALANEIPEESGQFRFLHAACFANLKGAVGFIMVKASVMRISIPLDLSSRSFVPLPCFIRSRRPTPL